MASYSIIKTLLALLTLWTCLVGVTARPSGLPAGFQLQDLMSGLGLVTDLQFLFSDTMILTFKNGTVGMAKIGSSGRWHMMPYPILDLRGKLGAALGDRGLLSVAIDPNVAKGKRYLYLAYVYDPTPINSLGPKQNRVSRFTFENKDLLYVNPNSEKILLGDCTPTSSWAGDNCAYMNGTTHSVDMIRFGLDKMLWITIGEGLIADGPEWTMPNDWPGPLDAGFLQGKLLRIDPATGNGLRSNPFFNGNVRSAMSKVYSVGLRNPFSGDFTLRTTPPYEMIVGDVGWFTWEGVKILKRGNSLGWPCYEGGMNATVCAGKPCVANAQKIGCQRYYNNQLPRSRYPAFKSEYMLDIWNHNGQSAAAVGGTFFGNGWPMPWTNCFIYADFVVGWVKCRSFDSVVGKAYNQPVDIMKGADNPLRFIKHAESKCIYMISYCEFCASGYGTLRRICNGVLPALKPNPTKTVTMTPRSTRTTMAAPTGGPNPCVKPAVRPTDIAALTSGWAPIVYASNMFSMRAASGGAVPRVVLNNNTDCARTACFVGIDASVGPAPKAFAGQPLQISGVRFAKGLGTAVTAQIDFKLAKACSRFQAYIGVDDEPGPSVYPSEFAIRRDDPARPGAFKVIFNSTDYRGNKAIQRGDAPQFIDVDIQGATTVSLLSFSSMGNKYPNAGTHLDWADAKFYCGPQSPFLPKVQIMLPDPTVNYRVGQNLKYLGYATDWQGNPIPASAYRWELNMIHGQGATFHTHPQVATLPSGSASGTFLVQPHSLIENQYFYYELKMYAKDGCGREGWSSIYLKARDAAGGKNSPGSLKPNTVIGQESEWLLRRVKRGLRELLGGWLAWRV